MTEYHYQATGKFYPQGTFGKWCVSATFQDGSQSFNIASNVNSPVQLDIGLTNYLSYKYQASSVFPKGQTFETQFTVVGPDGATLAQPTIGYNVSKCTYTVTDGDWTRGGGYFGTLVKALLSEKYGLTVEDFTCDLGTFNVTTWMYQPRGVSNVPAPTTVTNAKPAPTPAPVKPAPAPAPEPEDVLGEGMNIFGNGDDGDY